MSRTPVELSIGGKSYRLVANTDEDTLYRLARTVDGRLRQVGSRHPDAMLLVALALAKELEDARTEQQRSTHRSREMIRSLLARVDRALDHVDENGEPLPPVPSG